MIAPYFVHKVPYNTRVAFCAILSFSAVVLIALAETISLRMIGVMMASLSSGLGELTFLMLSSFYRLQMVSAWSSGTGGAGLLGALLFLALTSWLGLSVPLTLGVVSVFPSFMLFAYFVLLRRPSLHSSRHHAAGYRPISSLSQTISNNHEIEEEELLASPTQGAPEHHWPRVNKGNGGPDVERDHSGSATDGQTAPQSSQDNAPLSVVTETPPIAPTPAAQPPSIWDSAPSWEAPQERIEPTSINTLLATTDPDDPGFVSPFRESEIDDGLSSTRRRVYKVQPNEAMTLKEKLAMARSLLLPYMVPLFLVYVA
ncbi:CLN3 protein-domain-containing protein [Dissophora ornata]|nr:G1/S-specific cyclin cln3 [Dissophora ornata]KAI8594356.1 CLN3 protein-domain-containing protein [Dissophora ornata]